MRTRFVGVSDGVLNVDSCRGDGNGRTIYAPVAAVGTEYKILIPDMAQVDQYGPDVNYGIHEGASCNWATGNHKNICIYADLSAYDGKTVIAAALWLDETAVAGEGERTVNLYELAETFVEAEFTWNERSTGVNWSTAGGHPGLDLGPFTITKQQWNEFDIKDTVAAWLGGVRTNKGLWMHKDFVSGEVTQWGTDDAVDPDLRPYFLLTLS